MIKAFAATATTCEVAAGTQQSGQDGVVHVRSQTFTDIVRSSDQRVAGINKPVLDLDFNPTDGTGTVRGPFTLQPDKVGGAWEGHMTGEIRNGLVTAKGLARGKGSLTGSVMRVDFRQVEKLADDPPCANPTAFFEMEGLIFDRD